MQILAIQPNFLKKPWNIGKFRPKSKLALRRSLDKILTSLKKKATPKKPKNQRGRQHHESQLFLTRTLKSGIMAWKIYSEQYNAFKQGRLAVLPPVEVTDADDADDMFIQNMENAAEINNEDEFIEHFASKLNREVEDDLKKNPPPRRTSRGKEKDESSDEDFLCSSSSSESEESSDSGDEESDFGQEQDEDESYNDSCFMPDISSNVIRSFFRELNAESPLRCYYTIWRSKPVMTKFKIVKTLIPHLKELSRSKAVNAMIENPPKNAVSGRIESLADLSNKAKWNLTTEDPEKDDAEESGDEGNVVDAWNEYFKEDAVENEAHAISPNPTMATFTHHVLVAPSPRVLELRHSFDDFLSPPKYSSTKRTPETGSFSNRRNRCNLSELQADLLISPESNPEDVVSPVNINTRRGRRSSSFNFASMTENVLTSEPMDTSDNCHSAGHSASQENDMVLETPKRVLTKTRRSFAQVFENDQIIDDNAPARNTRSAQHTPRHTAIDPKTSYSEPAKGAENLRRSLRKRLPESPIDAVDSSKKRSQ